MLAEVYCVGGVEFARYHHAVQHLLVSQAQAHDVARKFKLLPSLPEPGGALALRAMAASSSVGQARMYACGCVCAYGWVDSSNAARLASPPVAVRRTCMPRTALASPCLPVHVQGPRSALAAAIIQCVQLVLVTLAYT